MAATKHRKCFYCAVTILGYLFELKYFLRFKTGNNIDVSEQGFLKDFSDDHPNGVLVQHGGYSYTAPDGQIIRVDYTADEHGFRATGDHIPTAAPIPPGNNFFIFFVAFHLRVTLDVFFLFNRDPSRT